MTPRDGHDFDESLLSAYVDGELDAATRAAVDTRLAESPEWRAVLEEVRAARDAVRALPLVEALPGFWDELLAADGTVVSLDGRRRRVRPGRWSALAGGAAAAAILGVVLVPRPAPVEPKLASLTQSHGERASLDNDVVSNLAGVVVPQDLAP